MRSLIIRLVVVFSLVALGLTMAFLGVVAAGRLP